MVNIVVERTYCPSPLRKFRTNYMWLPDYELSCNEQAPYKTEARLVFWLVKTFNWLSISFTMGTSNSKSSRYSSQRTAAEAMGKNNSEINTKRALFQPSVIQYTTDDGLNIKSVSLGVTQKHWFPVRRPVQRTRSTDHLTERSMDHLYGPPILTPSKNVNRKEKEIKMKI